MTENEVKNSICDYLSTLPGCLFTLTPRGNSRKVRSKYLPSGWPDLSGMIQKKYAIGFVPFPLFIEVKKPGGTLSKAQHDFILKAKSLGAIAFVAESVDDVKKELG